MLLAAKIPRIRQSRAISTLNSIALVTTILSIIVKQASRSLSVPTFDLTAQQRSELDRLTGDPEGGDLSGKLNELFVSPKYTKAVKELEKVIKAEPRVKAGFDPEAQSKRIMSVLHAEVNRVFMLARADAFNKLMESGTFPELIQQVDTEELRRLGQY